MSLTFVVGSPSDVFGDPLASAIEAELRNRFAFASPDVEEAYRSEPVDARGWLALQRRAADVLGGAAVPQLVNVDAYQAVYLPGARAIEQVPIANAADPLQVASLDALLDELRRFAAAAALPTDDVELMQLGAKYLEDDELFEADLDVQTLVQLMLSAKQAAVRGQALWVVT